MRTQGCMHNICTVQRDPPLYSQSAERQTWWDSEKVWRWIPSSESTGMYSNRCGGCISAHQKASREDDYCWYDYCWYRYRAAVFRTAAHHRVTRPRAYGRYYLMLISPSFISEEIMQMHPYRCILKVATSGSWAVASDGIKLSTVRTVQHAVPHLLHRDDGLAIEDWIMNCRGRSIYLDSGFWEASIRRYPR